MGRLKVSILGPQRTLAPLFQKADLVLTAGGGTLYELAYLGRPAVAVAKVRHQAANIANFRKAGCVAGIPSVSAQSAQLVANLIRKLISQPAELRRMSRSGLHLVDGRGMERVAKIMLSLLERSSAAS